MAFYGYTAQTPDFSFIAQAGKQAGETVEKYAQAKKIDIDNDKADKAFDDTFEAYKNEWKRATGKDDDLEASRFLAPYLMRRTGSETGSDLYTRLITVEPKIKAALEELKERRYFDETGKEPEAYSRLEGQVSTGQPRVGGQGDKRISAFPQTVKEMQGETMAEPSAPGLTTGPGMDSQGAYRLAGQLGLTGNKNVQANISQMGRKELAGNIYPEGTVSSKVYKDVLGSPVIDETMADYAKSYPSQKDVMTNDRLIATQKSKAIQEQKNLDLKSRIARIREQKISADERRLYLKDRADAQANALEKKIKIKTLEASLTKANKNVMGGIDQAAMQDDLKELRELYEETALLDENLKAYEVVLDDKYGEGYGQKVYPQRSAQNPAPGQGLPKFNSPSDPAFQALPSGSKFIDSRGVVRTKK